jgi:Flp pilus assembly protein TadG
MTKTLSNWFREHARLRRAFRRDKGGVSAIEFAFIFPVMITMYMGAVDVSQVLTADRKITTLASTAADLVAQAETVNAGEMADIYSAAAEIVSPFPSADLSIIVTSIELDENDDPIVGWSDAFNGTPRSSISGVTIPNGMIEAGGSVILAEVSYLYDSILTKFVGQDFALDDAFFLRPRQVAVVEFQ